MKAALVAAAVLATIGCSDAAAPTPGHPRGRAVTSFFVGSAPYGVAIVGRTAYVTQSGSDSIALLDLGTMTRGAGFKVGTRPDDIAVSPGGARAWVTNIDDGSLGVVDVAAHREDSAITGFVSPVRVQLGAHGTKLYVTMSNDVVQAVTAGTGTLGVGVAIGGLGTSLASTPDGQHIWVGCADGKIYEIVTATDVVGRFITMGGLPQDIAVSADGTTLFVANEAGWVGVYSVATAALVDSVPASAAFGLAITPDGAQVWVTRTLAGKLTIIDARSHRLLDSIPLAGAPRRLAFTGDGGSAVVANEAGLVQVIR